MSSWLRQSWLVLLLAGSLGTALSVVEQSLQGRIARNAADRLARAVFAVVPDGTRSEEASADGLTAWQVSDKDGNQLGWAVIAETSGFADRIRLMVGLSADRSEITGVAVLESRETPGLGERIREADFLAQFAERPTDVPLEFVRPGQTAEQSIDAISGATISSNAVVRAVNECVASFMDQSGVRSKADGITGAGS